MGIPLRPQAVGIGARAGRVGKPYRANGRIYVRVHADVHEATREELARLIIESGRVQESGCPSPDAELSELDDVLMRGYFADVRRLPYPDDSDERVRLLVNMRFATPHAGRVVPTVAGMLARVGGGQAPLGRAQHDVDRHAVATLAGSALILNVRHRRAGAARSTLAAILMLAGP